MRIPTTARIALIEAFAYFKRQPATEIFERPTHDIVRAKIQRVKRFPKSHELAGQIESTPLPPLTATQTMRGRTSTTSRCADLALMVGPILSAAEGNLQTPFGKVWLRYAYDDDCPADVKVAVHKFLMMAWVNLEYRSREYNPERMTEYGDLAMIAMIDMRHRLSSGKPIPWSQKEKSAMLGLNESGEKHWQRSWRPHERDMQVILDVVDREALAPVYAAIQAFAA